MLEPERDESLADAHILILEDEMLIRLDLEEIVKELGCSKVTAVGRADDALTAVSGDPVTLALLDIQLAGGTSYEVAAALQARSIPFIFTSGSQGTEVPEAFANVAFVDKPYETSSLVSALVAALKS